MEWISDPQAWLAFAALTTLEIVLGIDNIVFISILAGKLPPAEQGRARFVGLALAMVMRIALLLVITWVIRLTAPLFTMLGQEVSGRDLILIGGGLFLVAKATYEIHENLEGHGEHAARVPARFAAVIVQILLLDMVFSLDSVITAVGIADHIEVMIAAIVLAVLFMMVAARSIGEFVERHPTIKILALSFLLLIGVTLIADGLDQHIAKGYIYFAMGFSVFVETLNLRVRKLARRPVKLNRPLVVRESDAAPQGGGA